MVITKKEQQLPPPKSTTMRDSSKTALIAAATGKWKLRELWEETKKAPLSITRDGQSYVMSLSPSEDPMALNLSVQVSNRIFTQVNVLDCDDSESSPQITIHSPLSTLMLPSTEEKSQLENFLGRNFPKMTSVQFPGGEMVLESDDGATRIVCKPLGES